MQESGGLKAKEQIVRDVVARACSKTPLPGTQALERQEISLLRVPSQLRTAVHPLPDIVEGETADAGDISVRVTTDSASGA